MERRFLRPAIAITLALLTSFLLVKNSSAQDLGRRRQPITWRDVRAPFTPGIGAIIGGPGNGPEPGTPMYICRAQVQGSVQPGKWVGGNCNVPFNGSEIVTTQYQVAYGDAVWQPYSPQSYGLVRTGTDVDGSPLYSCRVHYNPGFPQGDLGNQPGKLLNGACRIPIGGSEVVINPPFEALYATTATIHHTPPALSAAAAVSSAAGLPHARRRHRFLAHRTGRRCPGSRCNRRRPRKRPRTRRASLHLSRRPERRSLFAENFCQANAASRMVAATPNRRSSTLPTAPHSGSRSAE